MIFDERRRRKNIWKNCKNKIKSKSESENFFLEKLTE